MSLLHPNLIAFMAVVERKTVQDAAKKIGLTQTGVTQRIRALEKELLTTLFIRSRSGMKLTVEGESLHRYCQSAVELEGQLVFESTQQEIALTISGPSSLMRSRVIPNVSGLLKKYPFLRVQFDLMDQQSAVHKLKNGTSQIVLVRSPNVALEMDSRILRPERYILVGPMAWKKRSIKDILQNETIIDFDQNDTYTFDFLEKYRLQDQIQSSRHYVNNTDALASMIADGAGYSVLAQELASELINRKLLVDLQPGKFLDLTDICLAWYPRPEMPAYFKDILNVLK
ncbi:LysR family transcriptional regulator [Bacteriovorax stolpii]|uniref:LysR family transcriptional regulator n=1 Tax=Bacteriovorax stolpii TaxID=960 RepID=A0A2K9NNW1_BACTC|nr:LysR family transcriptional regulator [Bacteriovorax stolpii]AUN97178.1 LysR family transcriptional regulator [Bacteriovorax stolpii]TDP53464.1 DNA-binding transcriptional LysR family regulator [Bacteriovorax stolpii]